MRHYSSILVAFSRKINNVNNPGRLHCNISNVAIQQQRLTFNPLKMKDHVLLTRFSIFLCCTYVLGSVVICVTKASL